MWRSICTRGWRREGEEGRAVNRPPSGGLRADLVGTGPKPQKHAAARVLTLIVWERLWNEEIRECFLFQVRKPLEQLPPVLQKWAVWEFALHLGRRVVQSTQKQLKFTTGLRSKNWREDENQLEMHTSALKVQGQRGFYGSRVVERICAGG